MVFPDLEYQPAFFSIVTPGQFPTFCRLAVKALKSVVLPQLGLPTSNTRFIIVSSNGELADLLDAAPTSPHANQFGLDYQMVQCV